MQTSPWEADDDIAERQLLQCMVEVARAAFQAEASSVFLVDDDTGELVFEAVAGRGEDHLIGLRLSEGTGIAGWVVACGQPVLADDLTEAPFSREAAEGTGYIPNSVAAAPLVAGGRCIGVLEVLDRAGNRDELGAQELLGLLASQAAAGVELLRRSRSDRRERTRRPADLVRNAVAIDRIAAGLTELDAHEARLLDDVLAFATDLADWAVSRRAASRGAVSQPPTPSAGRGREPADPDQGSA